MKYKFEISIAEIKDLGAGPFEFKIALDSMEQHLYDTDTFEIYGEGSFALGILVNDELIGGFRIPMNSLHKVSSHWFPATSPYSELLELPECVLGPRVYLSIIEITILSPVQEHRETSEYSMQSPPRVFSPTEYKHCEWEAKEIYSAQLSQMLEISKKEIFGMKELQEQSRCYLDKVIQDTAKREEELVGQLKSFYENNSKIESLNANLQAEIMKFQIENQCMKAKNLQMAEENEKLKEVVKDSEGKRKDLQNTLANAHVKWQELKPNFSAVSALEKENQNLLIMIKALNEKVKELEKSRNEDEGNNSMASAISHSLSQCKHELQEAKKNNVLLISENSHLKELLEKMRIGKLENLSVELVEPCKNYLKATNKEEKLDSIDRALRDYMKETGISNPFAKIGEGIYQYGSKKISLSLKNGIPVIRVGGGYMFIDEFLKIYNGQAKKKPEDDLTERSQSLEGKIFKTPVEKYIEDIEVENYPGPINGTPTASPMKKKVIGITYPTKSAILKKIPRLNSQSRELTPNSRRTRTPRQVFLP